MVELVYLFFLALAGTGRLLRLLDGMVVAFDNRVGGGDVIAFARFEKEGGTGVACSASAVVELIVLSCFTAMRPLPAAAAADGNIRSPPCTVLVSFYCNSRRGAKKGNWPKYQSAKIENQGKICCESKKNECGKSYRYKLMV